MCFARTDFPALLFVTFNSVRMAENCLVTYTSNVIRRITQTVKHDWELVKKEIDLLKKSNSIEGKEFSPMPDYYFQLTLYIPHKSEEVRILLRECDDNEFQLEDICIHLRDGLGRIYTTISDLHRVTEGWLSDGIEKTDFFKDKKCLTLTLRMEIGVNISASQFGKDY